MRSDERADPSLPGGPDRRKIGRRREGHAVKQGTLPSIAVVVLNWNGVDDTLACLDSLRRSVAAVHAIVVDNGSTGSDAERIRASELADTVIETGTNLGYAEGNNVGLRLALDPASGFEVVGVLNNDTVVDPRCFGGLVEQLGEENGPLRALAPTTLYFDDPGEPWFAGGIIDQGWPRHLQPSELGDRKGPLEPSEWLTGCCIVARAATWRHVGLFDSRYYLIFEDCEWSLRAQSLGVDLQVATACTIRHKVSRSFATEPSSLLGSYYYLRNGLRFGYAYAPRHLPRFLVRYLLRPTVSDIARLNLRRGLGFRWLGALAFVTGRTGQAPQLVARLAERRAPS
jgi:GT2 family glycosyltransferase